MKLRKQVIFYMNKTIVLQNGIVHSEDKMYPGEGIISFRDGKIQTVGQKKMDKDSLSRSHPILLIPTMSFRE